MKQPEWWDNSDRDDELRNAKMKFAQAAFTQDFDNPLDTSHPLYKEVQDYFLSVFRIHRRKHLEMDQVG